VKHSNLGRLNDAETRRGCRPLLGRHRNRCFNMVFNVPFRHVGECRSRRSPPRMRSASRPAGEHFFLSGLERTWRKHKGGVGPPCPTRGGLQEGCDQCGRHARVGRPHRVSRFFADRVRPDALPLEGSSTQEVGRGCLLRAGFYRGVLCALSGFIQDNTSQRVLRLLRRTWTRSISSSWVSTPH